jgi:hypothetical protein
LWYEKYDIAAKTTLAQLQKGKQNGILLLEG